MTTLRVVTHGKIILTTDFDLHRGNVVELRHALDFREGDMTAVGKSMFPVICADHNSRIPLNYKPSSNVKEIF